MRYIDRYIRDQSIELFNSIGDRKVVYLDMKYWILIRDHLSDESGSVAGKLARKFIALYDTKKCIYPVSEAVYWEILKQSDKASVIRSFELVEKLSEGIAIVGDRQRAKIEFGAWVANSAETNRRVFSKELVLGKLPLITGYHFYAAKTELLPDHLSKTLLDLAGDIPLSALVSQSQGLFQPFTGKDDIAMMNENKTRFIDENRSRKAMFLSELGGFLDCFKNEFKEMINDLFYELSGRGPTTEEDERVDNDAWSKAIYNGFRLGKIVDQLPLFRISPTLAGAMRWNKERKYTDGNDTLDIMHATAALPYCHYFFTERELHTIILQEQLDKMFDCITESKPEAVLAELNKI